jgi:hypothetical protein
MVTVEAMDCYGDEVKTYRYAIRANEMENAVCEGRKRTISKSGVFVILSVKIEDIQWRS